MKTFAPKFGQNREIKKGCEYYTSFELVEHTRLELVTFRLPV